MLPEELPALTQRLSRVPGRERSTEPGRLTCLLGQFPEGLARDELLRRFYPGHTAASKTLQESQKARLAKVIQRARIRFRPHGISVRCLPGSGFWALALTDCDQVAGMGPAGRKLAAKSQVQSALGLQGARP